MVAPNDAFERDAGVVPRVREWLQDVEAAGANPRLRGALSGLLFERTASARRDLDVLRARLERLGDEYPELAERVGLSDLLESVAERLSVEVT